MVISDLRGLATQQVVVTQKFTCPAQEGEAALSAPAAAENFVTDIAEVARQRLRSPFNTVLHVALIRSSDSHAQLRVVGPLPSFEI